MEAGLENVVIQLASCWEKQAEELAARMKPEGIHCVLCGITGIRYYRKEISQSVVNEEKQYAVSAKLRFPSA